MQQGRLVLQVHIGGFFSPDDMEVVTVPNWHPDTGCVGDLGQSFSSIQQKPGMKSLFLEHLLVSAALIFKTLLWGMGGKPITVVLHAFVFLLPPAFPLFSLEKD